MNFRTILCLAAALTVAQAEARAPAQTAAFGIALDATPQSVMELLTARYPSCRPIRSFYRDRQDPGSKLISEVAINPGLAWNTPATRTLCSFSPEGADVVDAIEARFAHPEVDARQGLYWLEVFRAYPDVVLTKSPRAYLTLDKLRAELFRTYGKPAEEKRQRSASTSSNLATSLGTGNDPRREDYLVRYLWSTAGRLDEFEREDQGCDCKGRYVKAVIEVTRSPSTRPRNVFHVLSFRVLVEDRDARARQAARDEAWRQNR